ncbi:MAG: hypothetical protein ACRCYA_00305 [Cetobacterium sp.]|uniref:hypothetical protein n=1 Tax=Cetobacterium sp. TaxID=2071632 RepID=UPI003F36BF09
MNEKGLKVYVKNNVWTIKKLNFLEKIILSDMINTLDKSGRYFKDKKKLSETFGTTESKITKCFEKLSSLNLIKSERVFNKDVTGKIVGCKFVERTINEKEISKIERFKISENNIFLKSGNDVCFTQEEIKLIEGNKNKANQLIALIIIVNKNTFVNNEYEVLRCRFSKTDLYEFMGLSRPTGAEMLRKILEGFRIGGELAYPLEEIYSEPNTYVVSEVFFYTLGICGDRIESLLNPIEEEAEVKEAVEVEEIKEVFEVEIKETENIVHEEAEENEKCLDIFESLFRK